VTRGVVVLGAMGFIGRHVCRFLAGQGVEVWGLGHGACDTAAQSSWGLARWQSGDVDVAAITALVAGEAPMAVIHCAGGSSVGAAAAAPLDDYRRSALSTAEALEFVRLQANPAARLVLASSAAVYGDQGTRDLGEASPRAPISAYGCNKVAAEDLCRTYAGLHAVPVSVVRLFSVYGEGLRKQLLWDAMRKFAGGGGRFYGTGQELRDWVHVDDAARLLGMAALQPQGRHAVYNGTGTQATTRQVLARLAECAGFPGEPVFDGEAHAGNPVRLTGDGTHARSVLGWAAATPLQAGLARYAEWFASRPPP